MVKEPERFISLRELQRMFGPREKMTAAESAQAFENAKAAVKKAFHAAGDPAQAEARFRELAEAAGFSGLLRPAKVELPTTAPALYISRPDSQQTPPEFVREHYAPWLGKGLTRAHVRSLDRQLYNAITNWLAAGKPWPPEVDLPSKPEQNSRDLAARREDARLSKVEAARLQPVHPGLLRTARNPPFNTK